MSHTPIFLFLLFVLLQGRTINQVIRYERAKNPHSITSQYIITSMLVIPLIVISSPHFTTIREDPTYRGRHTQINPTNTITPLLTDFFSPGMFDKRRRISR